MVSDEGHRDLWREELAPAMKPGAALIFAHGLSVSFGLVTPRADLDVILASPKGIGPRIRDLYVEGQGVFALFGTAGAFEFGPLKNARGAESPATVQARMSDLFAGWLESAGAEVARREDGTVPFPIEISPLYALDAAGRMQVGLGRDIALEGHVRAEPGKGRARHVPSSLCRGC